jgi:glutathione synthase/RimK-type ligase-like ATP-grasp enzyme
MNALFVVNRPAEWPFDVPGANVVTARAYLTDPAYGDMESTQVFNLCAMDRYQGRGYYVSLIAEARGQRPSPAVKTIEDIESETIAFVASAPGNDVPWPVTSSASRIDIDAYFGRDPARVNDACCERLCALLRAPLIRATFEQDPERGWRLVRVRLLGAAQLGADQRAFAARTAMETIAPARPRAPKNAPPSIALLHTPGEPDPPSNPGAMKRFCRIAGELGMRIEQIGREDIERLPEFDALFIRDTTHANHYTYQFARRAAAEGLVVIDDPDSILKCNNKVYLNELLTHNRIAVPRTLNVHRDNVNEIVATLGLPCILKQPDASFSRGVTKVESHETLRSTLAAFFGKSEIVIAQEWVPTAFDWRVGVLDGWPLYVCKYLMAPGHWQVVKRERGRKLEGATIALAVGEAPSAVVRTAVKAANLIGDGLYGVDIKEVGSQCYVIEVNDNPNIDAGNEDGILGDALYREVLGVFMRRIRERDRGAA